MKRPIKIMLILLGALILCVLVIMANIARSRSQVQGIEIAIRYGKTPALVGESTVVDTVLAAIPNLMQKQVKSVDCRRVEAAARRVPFLEHVDAQVSVSGKIVIRANQRRPIARLFYGNQEVYFDRDGALFPTGRMGDCDVLVAGGEFNTPLPHACTDSAATLLHQLWTLACFLDEESQYGKLVNQIFIQQDGDLMMVPTLGPIVELGTVDDLDEKFSNLWTFYRKGMPRAGWQTYSQISLKFKNQVVCTKK